MKLTSKLSGMLLCSLLLSRCSLIFPNYTAPDPKEYLAISFTSDEGLLGNQNIKGKIKNNGYSTVYNIEIEATLTKRNNTIEKQTFTINAGVPSYSEIAFKERLYTSNCMRVELKIIHAEF